METSDIAFIAHIDSIRILKDGDTKLTLSIPQSDIRAIQNIIENNSRGESNFQVAMIKLPPNDISSQIDDINNFDTL